MTKPRELSNVLNMKGELELLYGPSIEPFSAGIQQYLQKSSQHLKKYLFNKIKRKIHTKRNKRLLRRHIKLLH
jgi:hypothetical protein